MRLEDKKDKVFREAIFERVRGFYNYKFKKKSFEKGKTKIPYAGRVFDENELISLIDASLDFWLTAGRFSKDFEYKFTKLLGVDHCLLTNSGSSANLLAISALTSHTLGERRLKPGDEVITVACAFPTTVNPIVQNNLVPVFVDVDPETYNIIADKIEPALSRKTKAIFLAHTLGNPFDVSRVTQIAQKRNLWLIEDACDALGSKYNNRYTGTFGDIATFSFYPAHHITMGEGGAVVTSSGRLKRIIESFRDWGRDCWCGTGEDNTCKRRFGWQLGELPFGYDHKYIYSHIGYNLKITDMQAAIGVSQLKKLPGFIELRRRNWEILRKGLREYEDYFILPRAAENSEPSWFGFLLTRREDAPFSRDEIIAYLEKNNIATRMLFSGNIIRHPSFSEVKYRIYGGLKNTDNVMKNTFWIGVYPGLTLDMIEFILDIFHNFFAKNRW